MAILKVANIHHDASGFTRTQVFPANTYSVYTSGTERLRISPTGSFSANGNFTANGNLTVTGANRLGINRTIGLANEGEIFGSETVSGKWWFINSNQNSGAYNPLVQSGDHALIFSDGTSETGSFVIAPWSASLNGLRIGATGNVGIRTTGSGGVPLTVGHMGTQWDASVSILPTSFPTSNRAAIRVDNWYIGQDSNGNGAKDFFLYDANTALGTASSRVKISTDGTVRLLTPQFLSIDNSTPEQDSYTVTGWFQTPNYSKSWTQIAIGASKSTRNNAELNFYYDGPGSINNTFQLGMYGVVGCGMTTSAEFQINSGYGSLATTYGVRAWVNTGDGGTIRGAGNVSSVSEPQTYQKQINFTRAMPDANFSLSVMGDTDRGGQLYATIVNIGTTYAQANFSDDPSVNAVVSSYWIVVR